MKFNSCKDMTGNASTENSWYRIYWLDLKTTYVPSPKSITYSTPETSNTEMTIEMTKNVFDGFHDAIKMKNMEIKFENPLEIRSI